MREKTENFAGSMPGFKMGILFFFFVGLFDITWLFFSQELSCPFFEKIIGGVHFLSIYVLLGTIIGIISNFVKTGFLARRKSNPDSLELIRSDFTLYATLMVFLVLMYFVHARLLAQSLLKFVSIVATLIVVLLSSLVYVVLYKISNKIMRDHHFSLPKVYIALDKIARVILIFAIIIFPSTSFYFHKFPLYPLISSQANGVGEQGANPLNIVLITVDTLRADFIGCYGNERLITPSIDDLAKKGVIFADAIAQASLTTPSHASILTGTYVRTHGSGDNCQFMYDSVPTMAEILKNSGYITAAFVSGYPLKSDCCGIDRGFEVFNDQFSRLEPFRHLIISRVLDQLDVSKNDCSEQKAENANAKALYWLKKNYKKKFFLWIHYYDPHTPYVPPRRFKDMYSSDYKGRVHGNQDDLQNWHEANPEDVSEMVSLYKGEVSYTDNQIGVLLSELERLDLVKNTIIVFTSDHGEGLSEHGHYFDHRTLYDHDIKVPLVLSGHNILPEGKLVKKQVQSIDIVPTILDLLDIPISEGVEGSSLLNLIFRNDSNWPEESYSERREYVSLRTPSWKLILSENGAAELYDLEKDDQETQNVFNVKNDVTSKLLKKLSEYERKENRNETRKKSKMTEETKEKLRSLGYIK